MATRGEQTILLVEDNDAHAYLIRRHLDALPHVSCIQHASDGEQALSYLGDPPSDEKEPPTRPALILLDARLPKVSGLEVLRHIKSSSDLRSIPVVMLTTSIAEADVAAAYALQANGYLVKPMEPSRFAGMLGVVVRYWLKWNRPLPPATSASSDSDAEEAPYA